MTNEYSSLSDVVDFCSETEQNIIKMDLSQDTVVIIHTSAYDVRLVFIDEGKSVIHLTLPLSVYELVRQPSPL